MSPLEIIEDDCKSTHTFNITVKDIKHAKSLIHRFYVDEYNNLKELLESDIENVIGKVLRLRSPITCMTSNFKLCKTCVGNYNFTTPYVGILAGQYLEERLTQTTMSSHHLSGSATLPIDNVLKDYFDKKLINIKNYEKHFNLIFSENIDQNIIDILKNNENYRYVSNEDNIINFEVYNKDEIVENQDSGKIIENVDKLLRSIIKKGKVPLPSINTTYYGLIEEFFKISDIYTVFIEMLLANSHVNRDNIIYRYCLKDSLDPTIWRRYSIKSLNKLISIILSWLYEPNKSSIRKFYNLDSTPEEIEKLSVFEKIWLDKF